MNWIFFQLISLRSHPLKASILRMGSYLHIFSSTIVDRKRDQTCKLHSWISGGQIFIPERTTKNIFIYLETRDIVTKKPWKRYPWIQDVNWTYLWRWKDVQLLKTIDYSPLLLNQQIANNEIRKIIYQQLSYWYSMAWPTK